MPTYQIVKDAKISEDGRYRWILRRTWQPELKKLGVCMLNPSTADATIDDPTITRLIKRAAISNFGGIVVVNLFAFRCTDPKELWKQKKLGNDPFGPFREMYWQQSFSEVESLLLAWGKLPRNCNSDMTFITHARARQVGKNLLQLGLTKDGFPRHPLYVGASVPLRPYAGRYA